jgi:hypothetical protein
MGVIKAIITTTWTKLWLACDAFVGSVTVDVCPSVCVYVYFIVIELDLRPMCFILRC